MERLPSSETEAEWVSATPDLPLAPLRSDAQPGKWFIGQVVHDIDTLWVAIRDACRAGKLGRGVRCTTAHPRLIRRYSGRATIQVDTDDWRDTDEVWRVERELRRLGAAGDLVYKLDPLATGRIGCRPYRL